MSCPLIHIITMAFRFNPRIRFGNVIFGKRGVSVRTGIPGLTFQSPYPSGSSAANNNAINEGQVEPVRSVSALIWRLVLFTVFCVLVIALLRIFSFWLCVAFVAVVLYWKAYPALFTSYRYGTKQVATYARDRRYKTGSRFEGYRTQIDRDNKIYYEPEELRLSRIKGISQLVISGLLLVMAAPTKEEIARSKDQPDSPLTIKNLTVGSTVKDIGVQEGKRLQDIGEEWYYVDPTKFAKEKGRIDYAVKNGKVESITFKPADTSSYSRLTTLLQAKYGPARDSTDKNMTWETDSTKLEVNRMLSTKVVLKRSGFLN